LRNTARIRNLKNQLRRLRGELRELGRFGKLIGLSPVMQEVYDLIARVAPTTATALLIGESGTGKDLVAETIHTLSRRSEGPLFAVNCGAVSPTLVESELFGHEKGSFTGADRLRIGYFERAAGGTLFLDEITEVATDIQAKLLRALESEKFLRVGGTAPIETDVRIIAATNRDPHRAVEQGVLREDLFFRLNVFPIKLPRLRDREGDCELLAQHFLDELNRAYDETKRWDARALTRIASMSWPGNVRELRNAVHRAFIMADREIGPDAIEEAIVPLREESRPVDRKTIAVPVATEIAAVEKQLILATLDHFQGDRKKTAHALGISLKTLYNRLSMYRSASSAVRS
jgi:DNA-binding NtrC family response regulator